MDLFGAFLVLAGSLFFLLASVGLLRMPDVYNRMQAGTKATTLGSVLFLSGFAVLMPSVWPKIVVLIVFLFVTNPLSSHALARAARKRGLVAELGPDKKAVPSNDELMNSESAEGDDA
ncbi:MAG: monovalent cation/H(+) antiporter subunit G [Spirochaetales bacterium]